MRPAYDISNADCEGRDLVERVYESLRTIASSYMRRERAAHVLQPTALVHEAYLRMARSEDSGWASQTQFVGCAAHVMRQVLIDFARKANARKRKGEFVNWTVTSLAAPQPLAPEDFLSLDAALTRLGTIGSRGGRQARLVELVWLGGMGMDEAAAELGVSRRQANRDWAFARVWLEKELFQV